MRTQTLISLVVLLTTPPAWGTTPDNRAAVAEVLQQTITVEPERIAHHLLQPVTWPTVQGERPQSVAPPFPGTPPPPAITGETAVTGGVRE